MNPAVAETPTRLAAPTSKQDQIVVDTATQLAVVEVGLGALVHGFKIPFGGHALSINQGFFLTRALRASQGLKNSARVPVVVSTISAILKSLSPAGNKLGPMLSIAMQGFLFSLPIAILGKNLFTVALGLVLLSLWAFVQPFITLYVFYGHSLWRALEFYQVKMQESMGVGPESLVQILFLIVAVKGLIAIGVAWVGWQLSGGREQWWESTLLRQGARFAQRPKVEAKGTLLEQRWRGVLRDLTSPLFLFSFVLVVIFLKFSEGEWSRVIWLSMRPLAVAILFFYISRSDFLPRVTKWLGRFRPFRRVLDLLEQTRARLEKR